MKLHVITPYALNKNLGQAYNEAMDLIGEDDWTCLLDYDVQFLTPDAIAIIYEYINRFPDAGMLTCYTNRIGCAEQLLNGFSDSADILQHIKLAEAQRSLLYKVTELESLVSGFLMVISKRTWLQCPFTDNGACLGVDNAFARTLYHAGKKILRMDGLYVFHTYRLGKGRFDTTHLIGEKIVYSVITGNYDTLQPVKPAKGWRYICFTDTDVNAPGWEVIKLQPEYRLNRKVKLLPHIYLPPHSISIYHDGNIKLTTSPDKIAAGKTYCVMQHPERSNLPDELVACIRLKKDKTDVMTKQVNQYFAEGYNGNGMMASGVIIRTDTPQHRLINEAWWHEVSTHSLRDQLSFGYVCWKNKFTPQAFSFLQGFRKQKHLRSIQ